MVTKEQVLDALDDAPVDHIVTAMAARELAEHVAEKLNEQPADPQPVAVGFWCPTCQFFEEGDDGMSQGRCEACGCSQDTHVEVSVIPA